jgi:hypothetical protein
MQAAAAWKIEQWERAASRSSDTLAACSLERAVDGFIRGCLLAVEHRKAEAGIASGYDK